MVPIQRNTLLARGSDPRLPPDFLEAHLGDAMLLERQRLGSLLGEIDYTALDERPAIIDAHDNRVRAARPCMSGYLYSRTKG